MQSWGQQSRPMDLLVPHAQPAHRYQVMEPSCSCSKPRCWAGPGWLWGSTKSQLSCKRDFCMHSSHTCRRPSQTPLHVQPGTQSLCPARLAPPTALWSGEVLPARGTDRWTDGVLENTVSTLLPPEMDRGTGVQGHSLAWRWAWALQRFHSWGLCRPQGCPCHGAVRMSCVQGQSGLQLQRQETLTPPTSRLQHPPWLPKHCHTPHLGGIHPATGAAGGTWELDHATSLCQAPDSSWADTPPPPPPMPGSRGQLHPPPSLPSPSCRGFGHKTCQTGLPLPSPPAPRQAQAGGREEATPVLCCLAATATAWRAAGA